MKGLLSRGGRNCWTMVSGNLAKKDDKLVMPASSGERVAVNVFTTLKKS